MKRNKKNIFPLGAYIDKFEREQSLFALQRYYQYLTFPNVFKEIFNKS